ncbi:MAG: VCBS repeat-containing protein, partial [Bacteroidota bacterium]
MIAVAAAILSTTLGFAQGVEFHGPWHEDGVTDYQAVPAQHLSLDSPGTLGDIDGDGIDDFAVFLYPDGLWEIHLSGAAHPYEAVFPIGCRFPGYQSGWVAPSHPVSGDFWGTGHRAGAFGDYIPVGSAYHYQLNIYRSFPYVDPYSPYHCPDLILDPANGAGPATSIDVADIVTGDLDEDGDDELIVVASNVVRDNVSVGPEIWIYRGGPDFQATTPSLIIHDGGQAVALGDLDGDHHLDILTADSATLKIWWGGSGAPWSWGEPGRRVDLPGSPLPGRKMDILDCDGDGAKDIVVGSRAGVALYRSGQGKSTRTRSFAEPDVDALFVIPGMTQFRSLGPCNDSTRRYEMLGIVAHDNIFGFSGGPHGPSLSPQAFYNGYRTITEIIPLGDANGDSWTDFFALGDRKGATIFHPTLVLFGGGSYTAIESIGLGVDRIDIAEGHDVVTTWPVPATDILHVAWDGPLRRRPERFSISD